MKNSSSKDRYHVPILSKTFDILDLLQLQNQPVSLESVCQQTRFPKTTVYRILKTLVRRGYVAQQDNGLYRVMPRPRKMRFGFGGQSEEMPFSQAVTASLRDAASASGIDLLVLDNRYDGERALRNAEQFVEKRVDLVIEFQVDQKVAPIVADKIASASIPLIAVDIPHPHATFFGVDNYRAGLQAGEHLGQHARNTWNGRVNWVLGLDIEEAGPLVQSRITGAFEGVRSVLPDLPIESFVRIDGRALSEKSYRLVFDFLQRHPKDRRILIAAVSDTSALGALRAVKELKREKHVAIVGQDGIPEALEEMAMPESPLIASISHEAQTYGPKLIQLGLALLAGEKIAPYNFVDHKLITAAYLRGGHKSSIRIAK